MYSVKPRARRYSLACFCAHYIFIYIYRVYGALQGSVAHPQLYILGGGAMCVVGIWAGRVLAGFVWVGDVVGCF